MRRICEEWVRDYRRPPLNHYHAGLEAGECSQSGRLLVMVMESIVTCDGYSEADFAHRLDQSLFPFLAGRANQGPGGYTSQPIRETWRKRIIERKPWGQVAGYADTAEGAERSIPLAALFHRDLTSLATAVLSHIALTQKDVTVLAMSLAYTCVLALLLRGRSLDESISDPLMATVRAGELPFYTVTGGRLDALANDNAPSEEGDGSLRRMRFSRLATSPARLKTRMSAFNPHGK